MHDEGDDPETHGVFSSHRATHHAVDRIDADIAVIRPRRTHWRLVLPHILPVILGSAALYVPPRLWLHGGRPLFWSYVFALACASLIFAIGFATLQVESIWVDHGLVNWRRIFPRR